MSKTVQAAVSAFGGAAKSKLASPAISGAPEDQLRGPLEILVHELAELSGLPGNAVHLIGETSLADLKTRPDYAVTVNKALVGFIEVKAPGKGADPRKFKDPHDKDQWKKLKALPNLLYTDGNDFSLWRDGEIAGKIVRLDGDIETSGGNWKRRQRCFRSSAIFCGGPRSHRETRRRWRKYVRACAVCCETRSSSK